MELSKDTKLKWFYILNNCACAPKTCKHATYDVESSESLNGFELKGGKHAAQHEEGGSQHGTGAEPKTREHGSGVHRGRVSDAAARRTAENVLPQKREKEHQKEAAQANIAEKCK